MTKQQQQQQHMAHINAILAHFVCMLAKTKRTPKQTDKHFNLTCHLKAPVNIALNKTNN